MKKKKTKAGIDSSSNKTIDINDKNNKKDNNKNNKENSNQTSKVSTSTIRKVQLATANKIKDNNKINKAINYVAEATKENNKVQIITTTTRKQYQKKIEIIKSTEKQCQQQR